ncbi:MAG TPA: hemerythrin domain-containing protein [Burkholderiales bacterium]
MKHEAVNVILAEHEALAGILLSLRLMSEWNAPEITANHFKVMRGMLFYIDEFPERLHHVKESEVLFPKICARSPEACEIIARLDREHSRGEAAILELQHLLLAWEFVGEPRRGGFQKAVKGYVEFYLEHMRLEERELLPIAEEVLTEHDWQEVNAAFSDNRDPRTGRYPAGELYEDLFNRILANAPAPIGFSHPRKAL